jgi:hypothetical protein
LIYKNTKLGHNDYGYGAESKEKIAISGSKLSFYCIDVLGYVTYASYKEQTNLNYLKYVRYITLLD